jgi:hypothetical protein
MPNDAGTAEKSWPPASLSGSFGPSENTCADTSSSLLATTRTAPRMPVSPNTVSVARS